MATPQLPDGTHVHTTHATTGETTTGTILFTGRSNTVLVAWDDTTVTWTHPENLTPYDPTTGQDTPR